jgi:hypothetical protein
MFDGNNDNIPNNKNALIYYFSIIQRFLSLIEKTSITSSKSISKSRSTNNTHTLKVLLSEQHRDFRKVFSLERCSLIEVLL